MTGFADFPHVDKLNVSLDLHGEKMRLGTLARGRGDRKIYFEYDATFLARRLDVSPFKLDLRAGARTTEDGNLFDGLYGLFNDSLPDGWGWRLLDKRLRKKNYNPDDLTALDRLSFVGSAGMGALTYDPVETFGSVTGGKLDLDALSEEAGKFEGEFSEADVDKLQNLQGFSGGARPKIMIGRHPDMGALVEDFGAGLPKGFEAWIAKFRSKANDPEHIGAEEFAYSLMAKASGIDMPITTLLRGNKGRYFAVKRFDRASDGRRHVHTACGLLHASHREASMDYTGLLKLTQVLTRDKRHVEQMFTRMVFNVLARNRDDHTKNHAFQMSSKGVWTPTPAYDLTLSRGINGEHTLAIAGEGAKPVWRHIAREAELATIPKGEAEAIFQKVKTAVDKWPAYAKEAELPEKRAAEIDYVLNSRGPKPEESVEASTPPSP